VQLEDRRRCEALVRQLEVPSVQVLRLEPVDPMMADCRHDPHGDLAAVALQRRGPHLADGDRVEPVPEPLGDRWGAAGCLHNTAVALLLERPHVADNVSPLHRRDVTPVSLPLAFQAHRDVAVPPPGGVLVDGALAVRRSGH